LSDSRLGSGGCQHLPEVPDNLQQPIARWNHDPVDEAAERLTSGLALLFVFVF
jgi:hypothetical protein